MKMIVFSIIDKLFSKLTILLWGFIIGWKPYRNKLAMRNSLPLTFWYLILLSTSWSFYLKIVDITLIYKFIKLKYTIWQYGNLQCP
jgi:hypothetical protein